ncbi:MAG: hypothetical protein ACRD3B_16945 [Candidatus Sulfotelmatobacter sp.]
MMASRLLSLSLLLVLAVPFSRAQNQQGDDLKALLQDASYVLNRFEEVTTGLDVTIDDFKAPASLKRSLKGALASVRKSVEIEKPELNAALAKKNISMADLFDVYDELLAVAGYLEGTSSDLSNWGSDNEALEFEKLGARARNLGTDLGVALRSKIAEDEAQLSACSVLLKSDSRKK